MRSNKYVINDNMTAKYLASCFGNKMTETQAEEILGILGGRIRPETLPGYEDWIRPLYFVPSWLTRRFWAITQVAPDAFNDHNTEVLCEGGYTSPQRMDGSDIVFESLPVGDPYVSTIGYDFRIRRWVVTTCGDLIEGRYRKLLADRTME